MCGGELDEIQRAYNKLKRSIREKTRDVCLYVTMGELLRDTEVLRTVHRQQQKTQQKPPFTLEA